MRARTLYFQVSRVPPEAIQLLRSKTLLENLLNQFDIENVSVFEKNGTNSTEVITYTKEQFAGWYDDFSLGQMWKQGDLGGVRYGG